MRASEINAPLFTPAFDEIAIDEEVKMRIINRLIQICRQAASINERYELEIIAKANQKADLYKRYANNIIVATRATINGEDLQDKDTYYG